MRFFIGALAFAVVCAIFVAPALLVLGWSPLTANERQTVGNGVKDLPSAAGNRTAAR